MDDSTVGFPHHGAAAPCDEADWSEGLGRSDAADLQDPVVSELRTSREKLALTLTEVAERSGLAEPALSRWEHGAGSPPLDALRRWAGGLGLSLELVRAATPACAGYRLEWDSRRLVVNGKPVRLTRMEWNILERLAWSPGQLVTHRDLFRYLYGEERQDRAQATAIRVRISKLRQKVPFRIEARWGQGYVVDGVEAPLRRSQPQPDEAASPVRSTASGGRAAPPRPKKFQTSPLMFAAALPERPRRAIPVAQALRMEEPVKRMVPPPPPPVPTNSAVRAAELGVIERFLTERGATRCPDPRMLAQQAVPALVWDKIKRKWVRPAAEPCGAGLTQ